MMCYTELQGTGMLCCDLLATWCAELVVIAVLQTRCMRQHCDNLSQKDSTLADAAHLQQCS